MEKKAEMKMAGSMVTLQKEEASAQVEEEGAPEKVQRSQEVSKKSYPLKTKSDPGLEKSVDSVEKAATEDEKLDKEQSRKRKLSDTEDGTGKKKAEPAEVTGFKDKGFNRGLQPARVVNACQRSGDLMLLMKWKGSSETDWIPARQVNLKYPQLVIAFYERHITAIVDDSDDDDDD